MVRAESAATAIVCDAHGVITRVVHDQLGLFEGNAAGQGFVELVDLASTEKAAGFIHAVRTRGLASGWRLNVVIDSRVVLLHCMGCCDGQTIWIIMADTEAAAMRTLEELTLIQSEQYDILRAVLKDTTTPGGPGPDESQFENLTRLYNDLTRVQRELAQRNTELERLRAELEAKHAALLSANAKLEAMARTDSLTGIANRGAFQDRLEAECARSGRYGTPLALMMLDADHFKQLNDTHGHAAGDQALKTLAHLLAQSVRSTDIVARYGGEEFVGILVSSDPAAAKDVAERLRRRIEAEPWPHGPLTVSIGLASWRAEADTPEALVERADTALYYAKGHGRNRTTHFQDI